MGEQRRPGIAVLASGSGSTVEAFVHATEAGIVDAQVGLVISNNSTAGVFNRIRRLNRQYGLSIRTKHISGLTHPCGSGKRGEQSLAESEAIAAELYKESFALVALMGYMKKIRGALLDIGLPVVNTHPGPLPQTKGLFGVHVQEAVLEQGLDYSAQTFHLVAEEYDDGPVIAVHRVPVLASDTPDSLFESVQLTEKAYLPIDINTFLHGKGSA